MTFAFGGVYPSTLVVPGLVALALAVAYRPRILTHGPTPRLDLWILVVFAAAAVQALPMPRGMLHILSPNAEKVAAQLALTAPAGWQPLTIDLSNTAAAVGVFGGMAAIFFTARQLFDAGGVRTVARGVALIGLVLAAIAIAQDATGNGLMYWRWKPTFERTHPFGPFVNRNHFATWAIVAVPLCIGYLCAHAEARRPSEARSWRAQVVAAMDGRTAMLLGAAALLIVGVVLSLSRSGMVGMTAALVAGGAIAHSRASQPASRRAPAAMLVGALAVITAVLVVLRVPVAQLADRVSGVPVAVEDRVTIWHDTLRVVRDFWVAGTGAGTYQTSMAIYQRTNDGLIYNQAHNHYLQVLAEGGLLLALPVLIGLGFLAREGAAALTRDRSGMFWIRAGAASGLVGVAVQSLLETGLLTPANAVLTAIAAAILVHVPGRYGPPRMA